MLSINVYQNLKRSNKKIHLLFVANHLILLPHSNKFDICIEFWVLAGMCLLPNDFKCIFLALCIIQSHGRSSFFSSVEYIMRDVPNGWLLRCSC
jgi:quinol-cytochrome oxidoreductase complex cytochrome b subunit